MSIQLPAALHRLLCDVPELRHAYLVGGCVRDSLWGLPLKDVDIEVFGVSYDELASALRPHGRVDLVGRSFGVAKVTLDGETHDFSVPRRDSKVGSGHRGFTVELDPSITPEEAASRRDFTINSLMLDPRTGQMLDFFGGRADLENRILRHTSSAFDEDPLRVLRGMQFVARFELSAAPETLARCRSISSTFPELAAERVRDEWFKWAARSRKPSLGLHFLADAGWLHHFPELDALRGVPQDPEWHPEGDVFVHTLHTLDALVQLPEWREAPENTRIVLSLALLTHDLGKVVSTQTVERDGRQRIVSPGHESESARLAGAWFQRLLVPHAIVERVVPLVAQHMARFEDPTDRTVRRLARRLQPESIETLCTVMTADASGRPPRPPEVPASVRELRAAAQRLQVSNAAPQPFVLGRHLLSLGFTPGPEVGRWTQSAYEAQLDGHFDSVAGGIDWLRAQPTFPSRSADSTRGENPPPPLRTDSPPSPHLPPRTTSNPHNLPGAD